ncbi:MAG TPA: SNF2-related protein [Bacteriovoracaceae bacterium]|nr:SNF2-related protein [Bacteriovoracaceae bacterium]
MSEVGRNSPCPCGSEKKYKRCCGINSTGRVNSPSDSSALNSWDNLPKKLGERLNLAWLREVPLNTIFECYFENVTEVSYQLWLRSNLAYLRPSLSKQDHKIVLTIVNNKNEASVFIELDGCLKLTNQSRFPSYALMAILRDLIHRSPVLCSHSSELSCISDTLHALYGNDPHTGVNLSQLLLVHPDSPLLVEKYGESRKLLRSTQNSDYLFKFNYQLQDLLVSKKNQRIDGRKTRDLSILDHFEFVFSNGCSLALDELVSHPYFFLLPEEMRNIFYSHGWSYERESSNFFGIKYPSYTERIMGLFVLALVKSHTRASNSFLITDVKRDKLTEPDRKFVSLKTMTLLSGKDFTASFYAHESHLRFELRGQGHLEEMLRYGSLFFSSKRNHLALLGTDSWEEEIGDYEKVSYQKADADLKGILGTGFFSTESFELESFQSLCSHLERSNVFIDLSLLPELPNDHFKVRVNLSSEMKNEVRIEELVGGQSLLWFWAGQRHLLALNGGFGAVWDDENSNLAVHSGDKRKYDLKFLRHQGLYLLLLAEYLRLFAEDEINKKVHEKIITVAHDFFSKVIQKSALDLDDDQEEVCTSKKMDQLLKRWVNDLHEDFSLEMPVFIQGQFYRVSMGKLVLKTGLFILELLKKHLNPKSLLKEKNNDFKLSFSFDSCLNLVTENAFEATLKAHDGDAIILIDGNPINVLDASQIWANFDLDEGLDAKGNDWFSLHPKIFFEGEEISLEEALSFTRGQFVEFRGKTYVINTEKIPALHWLDYFWQKLGAQGNSNKKKSVSNIFHLPKSQILTLLAMKHAGLPVIGGERWKKIEQNFDALSNEDEAKNKVKQKIQMALPHIPLKPFQIEGVLWLTQLTSLGLGGILADDMGLGKTLQTLAFLSYIQKTKDLGPTLIVVPTSLVYNWQKECEKFTPEIKLVTFDRSKKEEFKQTKDQQVILVSYGLITEHPDFFQAIEWDYVIFDEAQNLKNISSQRTTEARKLKAKHKIALTGTPMENHYGEFYSLIDLILPGSLGDYSAFTRRYIQGRPSALDLDFLKLATRPLILRRQKKFIMSELPAKTESIMKLDFEVSQKEIYRNVAMAWNDSIKQLVDEKGESKGQVEMLTALLRLRQVCSYPQLVPEINYAKTSPKEGALLAQVRSIVDSGESVLIFTHFKGTLDIITQKLEDQGIKNWAIHGSLSMKERKRVLTSFDEPTANGALVMTLKTGGVGLNLTKASYVIHLEPWWNPAVENQATDRAHRMGQTKSVQVYRYLMKDSVEERMEALKDKKKRAFDRLFEEAVDLESTEDVKKLPIRSGLSHTDFEYLLGVHGQSP